MTTPRYLTTLRTEKVVHRFTDILIIGGGIAGLRAALAVPKTLAVMLVTKEGLDCSCSSQAQGGIAAVLDPLDRFEDHVSDTLIAGAGLCDREVVEMVVREAPQRIHELLEWGTHFDQSVGAPTEGHIALSREGGHGHNRIAHAHGDATGREIVRALIESVKKRENISIYENMYTIDLLTSDSICRGAMMWDERFGQTAVWARQTILTTGGAGQLYRETTNPRVATGDGMALAYRAGAELRDMEFMQFHPTVLYIAGSSRSLITEAMRGEGAWLVDRFGYRFMPDYDERAELAPRDIVSRAIVDQMERTKHSNVYLTLAHLDADFIRNRFPGIAEVCEEFDLDLTRDRIPVRPGAHYMMGGVTVDMEGRTTLPGLWAAGEVTSSGLHGANRLASNSLLEALVYGAHAGEGAGRAVVEMADRSRTVPAIDEPASVVEKASVTEKGDIEKGDIEKTHADESIICTDVQNALKSLMWRNVGVRRSAESLFDALEQLAGWARYVYGRRFASPDGWELQNMICTAKLMVQSALERCESRGGHFRTDFPERDDAWLCRIACLR